MVDRNAGQVTRGQPAPPILSRRSVFGSGHPEETGPHILTIRVVKSVSVRLVVTRLAPNGHQDPRQRPQERENPATWTGSHVKKSLQKAERGGFEPPGPVKPDQRFSRAPKYFR